MRISTDILVCASGFMFFNPAVVYFCGLWQLHWMLTLLILVFCWCLCFAARVAILQGTSTVSKRTYVLQSLASSPYVEAIRWTLDRMSVDYEVEEDAGIWGFFWSKRSLPVLTVGPTRLSDSLDILTFLYADNCINENVDVSFLEPTKEVAEMLKYLNVKLGRAAQQWAYHYLLQDEYSEETKEVWQFYNPKVPLWQRLIVRILFPVLRSQIRHIMSHKDLQTFTPAPNMGFTIAKESMEHVFTRIENMMFNADGSQKRPFIMGDKFTIIDIVFASLSSVFIVPEEFLVYARLRTKFSSALNEEIEKYRNRPAGKYALHLYKNYRARI